uniref:SAM domain-containing protein n=1 Tax=Setaria digitata TaxID=48799 RepID=A0A915PZV9_9BILA
MSTTERLRRARTMGEILFILNMSEYLPLFEKANVLQASALRLLREADLKYIGIDKSGRQKLLRAIRCLSKEVPGTIGGRIRQGIHSTVSLEPKQYRINEEEFCLQKAEDELSRCKVELNLKRNELARLQKQAKLISQLFEMASDVRQRARKLREYCGKCDNLSIQRLSIDLESILSDILVSRVTSIPSSCSEASRSESCKEYNSEPCNSNKTGPGPWYTKILKPIAIQRCRQVSKHSHCFQHRPSPSPIIYYPADEDCKATVPLSTTTISRTEHPSFVDEFFSKFGKNKTSTPYKQPAVKRYSTGTRLETYSLERQDTEF